MELKLLNLVATWQVIFFSFGLGYHLQGNSRGTQTLSSWQIERNYASEVPGGTFSHALSGWETQQACMQGLACWGWVLLRSDSVYICRGNSELC